jgi:hypothetical protein
MIMDYSKIKPKTIAGIRRYADLHCPTGSFLYAVLSNDLKEAVACADAENITTLPEIVCYCYNEIPYNCWGSLDKVQAWLNMRSNDSRQVDVMEGRIAINEYRQQKGE